jgi:hypothetical protein
VLQVDCIPLIFLSVRQYQGEWVTVTRDKGFLSDEEFASFSKKYPSVERSDIEELVTKKMIEAMGLRAQKSEIENLRNKALGAMGTDQEMRFSDIESGMLRASLSDGRQALKEIMENIPVETPPCEDGTRMRDQGRKKKRNDGTGAC